MAAMTQTIDGISQRLSDAISDASDMLGRLRPLLPEPDASGPQTGTIGRHAPESREPWNRAVADAYWNLWFGPGVLVNACRIDLGLEPLGGAGQPGRLAGQVALSALRNLVIAAPGDLRKHVIAKLERWVDLARAIPAVDISEPWSPVPAAPGQHPPPCPYCKTYGLRMQRRRGQVRCAMPGCKDADGMPTRARMEPGAMTGEERLVFTDGTTMFWTGDGNG